MSTPLQVTKSDMLAVLTALQVWTAKSWSAKTMTDKVNAPGGVARFREEGSDVADPAARKTYDAVTAAQAEGRPVEVTDDAPAPADVPPKKPAAKPAAGKKPAAKKGAAAGTKAPAAKPAGRPASSPTRDMSWPERVAYWKKHPRTLPAAGVFRTVYEHLVLAGKGAVAKPITKDDLVNVLVAAYPDRQAHQMRTTVSNLVPGRLTRKFGITVLKGHTADGKTGYWVGAAKAPPAPAAKAPAVPVTVSTPTARKKKAAAKAAKKKAAGAAGKKKAAAK